jgi:plasmid maintenance system antidote protein VapI
LQVDYFQKNYMGIPDRLRDVIGEMTVDAFAEMLQERPQRLKDVLRGKQKLPEDLLVKLVQIAGVDANWLLTGAAGLKQRQSARETALLDNYRHSTEEGKRAIEAVFSAMSQRQSKSANSR